MSDNLKFEISKDYTWDIQDLTDKQLKIFIDSLSLTETNCSAWLWDNKTNHSEIRREKYLQWISRYYGLWTCPHNSKMKTRNAKELFNNKDIFTPSKQVHTILKELREDFDKMGEEGAKKSFNNISDDLLKYNSSLEVPGCKGVFTYKVGEKPEQSNYIMSIDPYEYNTSNSLGVYSKPNLVFSDLVSKELSRVPTEIKETEESNEGIFGKEFYYNKSKHGDNFYQIIKTLPVKNEYHDWEDYYLYKQCGTGLEFLKPIEMFNKEFKKVRILDEI